MIHTGILEYRRARYLRISLILVLLCSILYLTQSDSTPPNGGTWQGYTLGGISAALVVWLSLLGVRKRRYGSRVGTVSGWTSAHVYLGAGVIIITTLHSAAQLGWNVHSLAYLLLCFVVFSGFLGIYLYVALPRKSLANRNGRSRDQLFAELAALDEQGRMIAPDCSSDIAVSTLSAIQRTDIGGGVIAQLRRRGPTTYSRSHFQENSRSYPLKRSSGSAGAAFYHGPTPECHQAHCQRCATGWLDAHLAICAYPTDDSSDIRDHHSCIVHFPLLVDSASDGHPDQKSG